MRPLDPSPPDRSFLPASSGRRGALVIAALLPVLLSGLAGAAEPEAFAVFLGHFCGDPAFRSARTAVPLAAKLGNKADGEPAHEEWSREEIARSFVPPLSASKLREHGLAEKQSLCGSECREVLQYRREADDYLLTYRFERRGELWFLVEYRDESL